MSSKEYHESPTWTSGKPIDAAKEAVPIVDLAGRLCGDLKPVGGRYEACCPLPDHDDKTPSFNVYPDTQSFHCFGCGEHGDVVDLYAACNGYPEPDMTMAAANLLHEFGHEIPQKRKSWHRRLSRQEKVREEWKQVQVRRAQRLIWRYLCRPAVLAVRDPELREKEAQHGWEDAGRLAYLLVTAREGERV